jgi:tRNA modification GTPase
VVRGCFSPASGKSLPDSPVAGTVWFGRFGEGPAAAAADEVVLAVKQPLPAPWVELHCHGGREVIRYLLEIIESRGVRVCSWQELERQTDDDPGRAAALAALAQARTVRTAAILLDQFHGAFARSVAALRSALQSQRQDEAAQELSRLARYSSLGRHLTVPWRVVIAGAPNVGKSSLVNALAGYQRSVVAATPGTTRDVVTTLIAAEGWPVEIADTAGLRGAPGGLEQMGIERARQAAAAADLSLWVLDVSGPTVGPPPDFPPVRWVVNKVDLPPAPEFLMPAGAVAVSARTGAGLPGFCQALAEWLVPDPPPPGEAVPFTPTLCDRVKEAHHFCRAGRIAEALQRLEDPFG